MEKQVLKRFLNRWGKGIVSIGKLNDHPLKQKENAQEFIREFYGYDDFQVVFKPTKAVQIPFRKNFEGALSYFIANNPNFPEDHGFALTPWQQVRFEFAGIQIVNGIGMAMGNYFFLDKGGHELKAEFSFVVTANKENLLKIILHHSSLPFNH